jgi:deazaflavin-dependent oxidoreductase (nitroreductase family)
MTKTFKVDRARRIADKIVRAFLALHLAPRNYYLLTTVGRKSGQPHSTPVVIIQAGSQRWLVSPFGKVGWVFNIRASGQATLTRNGKSETVTVKELSAQQAAPILRQYVIDVVTTRQYFDVKPDSAESDYIAEAPRHPVFEILETVAA